MTPAAERAREAHLREAQAWLARSRGVTTAAGLRVCAEEALEHLDEAQRLAGHPVVLKATAARDRRAP